MGFLIIDWCLFLTAIEKIKIPLLGFGTYKARGSDAKNSVYEAIKVGYRHIDTAAIYENEEEVGMAIKKAIKELGIKREEIFVTTKLWDTDYDDPIKAFNNSLKRLGLDYVDLYLIHWPAPESLTSWEILQTLLKEKRVHALGVSNFLIKHLKQIQEKNVPLPAVNQEEYSPLLQNEKLLEFCKEHNIVVEAYSPLTFGKHLEDKRLTTFAKKHGKTPAQILLRWAFQKGLVTLPKTVRKERIKENFDILDFKLTLEDMKEIDKWDSNYRTHWDPNTVDTI